MDFNKDVSIQTRPPGWRGIKEERFFVCVEGVPAGPMFDFFGELALRNPYPFKSGQPGFAKRGDAAEALTKFRLHFNEVLALPLKKRPGSSKFWK